MAKAAVAADSIVEGIAEFPGDVAVTCHHHLADALAGIDDERDEELGYRKYDYRNRG